MTLIQTNRISIRGPIPLSPINIDADSGRPRRVHYGVLAVRRLIEKDRGLGLLCNYHYRRNEGGERETELWSDDEFWLRMAGNVMPRPKPFSSANLSPVSHRRDLIRQNGVGEVEAAPYFAGFAFRSPLRTRT